MTQILKTGLRRTDLNIEVAAFKITKILAADETSLNGLWLEGQEGGTEKKIYY